MQPFGFVEQEEAEQPGRPPTRETEEGMELMIACARATRGLRTMRKALAQAHGTS